MTGLALATLISGIVAAVGSLVGGFANNNAIKKTNEANINNQNKVNADNLANQWKMFHATNEYNTYSAQMARAVEAGLNPNLVAPSSTNASAVNVGNSKASMSMPSNFDFLGNTFGNLANTISAVSGVEKSELDNTYLRDTLENRTNLTKHQADYAEKQLTIIGYSIEDRNIDKAIKETKLLMDNLNYNYTNMNYEYDKYVRDELGFPPDVDGKTVFLYGMLNSFFENLTGYDIKFNEMAKLLGIKTKDLLKIKKD